MTKKERFYAITVVPECILWFTGWKQLLPKFYFLFLN